MADYLILSLTVNFSWKNSIKDHRIIGLRIEDRGSRIEDRGSRIKDQGSVQNELNKLMGTIDCSST